jgi:hypothetical protein
MAEAVIDSLVAYLRSMREAERDIFGALDPAVRDSPLREGDWSPKDHQAHLTAWKARQANRYASARQGEDPSTSVDGETDVINAELQAARADWTWEAIVEEADEVSDRLIREVSTTTPEMLTRYDQLIGGTFGNGPFHAMQHFGWLEEANIGVDPARMAAFVTELSTVTDAGGLSEFDRGTAFYNIACYHALAHRLEEARPLLRRAFQLRPDLAEFAKQDTDLTALRDELPELATTAAS